MSEDRKIAEHFLPKEMRIDMCMALLEEVGAEKINLREERGEIIHCCVMPWHQESHPSASLNFDRLTYRCLGCSARGGMWWLIGTLKGVTTDQAKEWLAGETGLGGRDFQLGPLLSFLDAIDEMTLASKAKAITPRYSEKVLEPWNYVCPLLSTGVPDLGIKGRGIPEENLVSARVGWDMDANRAVIPLFLKGELVGWQSRRLTSDGTPKYLSTPDFPRDSSIYGLPEDKSEVHVVESPMSRLRHMHHAPVAATWGSVVTPSQIQLLKWFKRVVFFPDNDPAGWKTIEGYVDEKGEHHLGAAQQLEPYTQVFVVEYDWHADPAELDDQEYDRLTAQAVPLSIWQRPTGVLRCILCHEQHIGTCDSIKQAC